MPSDGSEDYTLGFGGQFYSDANNGRLLDGTVLAGSGRQEQYGPFSFDAEIAADGPRAVLVLADPLPAAGLKDVRIALAPSTEGFGLDVSGDSLLGEFDGALELFLPENAPTRIAVNRLDIYRTTVTGEVVLQDEGVAGDLVERVGNVAQKCVGHQSGSSLGGF